MSGSEPRRPDVGWAREHQPTLWSNPGRSPDKLWPCEVRWPDPGGELIIAEGDSAAEFIAQVRDARWQAVLAVQGKPMNAMRASAARIDANEQLCSVRDAIGAGWGDDFDLAARHHERVVLLFDPDVDGIHSRSLMLLFFLARMQPLLDAGAVFTARPPLWEFRCDGLDRPVWAWTDQQRDEVLDHLRTAGHEVVAKERFRGLASMSAETLARSCLDPSTRALSPLGRDHAEAVLRTYDRLRPQ